MWRASKQYASMCTWLYFLPHSSVFVLKLRESLLKSLKITFKRLWNPYWGAGKLLNHRTILFKRNNFGKNDLHTSSPAQLPQMTTTTLTSFPYDRNSKFSLKFTLENTWLKIHRVLLSYACTWRRPVRIAKLTRTRGIVYWSHQRAQWEYEARSRYWIWLGEYSSYVIIIFS